MNYLVGIDLFFPDQASGAGRVAWDQMRLMRDRGHKITVFCRKINGQQPDVEYYEGIRIVRFALPIINSCDPLKFRRQKQAGLIIARKYLADTNWDLVHIHIFLYGHILFKLLGYGPAYVYTVHSPVVMEQQVNWATQGLKGKLKLLMVKGILKRLEGSILEKAERIQTLSRFTMLNIEKYYHCADKVTVIPHWCREDFVRTCSKTEARQKLKWPADIKVLFTVRRLVPRMGLGTAIEGLAPLLRQRKDVNFVIAGSGILDGYLKQQADSLGVSEKIKFLGQIDDETLKKCYEGADLFIMPTMALECFGLPILEAFAFGLPVISTNSSALPELMGSILPDCMVPAGDPIALREKVEDFLKGQFEIPQPEELIAYVRRNFGADIIVPRLVNFLEFGREQGNIPNPFEKGKT